MKNCVIGLAIVLLVCFVPGRAAAACPPRLEIALADGSRVCLNDHPLGELRPSGHQSALRVLVASSWSSTLAMPGKVAACPAVAGFAQSLYSGSGIASNERSPERLADLALSDCNSAVRAAGGSADCACTVVVAEGRSPLGAREFAERARAVPPVAAAQAPRVAPALVPDAAPVAPAANAAAACPRRLQIALADGSRVCLTDHPLAELRPSGSTSALKDLVASSWYYTLAMPGKVAACPVVASVAQALLYSAAGGSSSGEPQQRAGSALHDCNAAVRAAGGSADCACRLVAADGYSSLNAREFGERARLAPPVAAAAQPQAVAATPGPQTQPTSAADTAAPTASPPNATVGPSTADFAALRQQIESLQAQVSRQGAAPAQPPVAARPAAAKLRARALVVGNGAYASLGVLGNPRNDAQAIAERLRKFGVEVDLVLDAGRTALVKALTDYQSRATGYDVNILFYAGHGLQVGGINYLVPVDLPAENATVGSVRFNALSLNDVLEYLSAPTRVVFLDACRDNPLSRSLVASRSTAGVGLAPVNATSGTLVAYATKDGSTAEDGRGRHSPYTSALLQHLDAEEDVAIVLRRVRQAVLKATNSRQEPWEYGSLIGDQLVLSRLGR